MAIARERNEKGAFLPSHGMSKNSRLYRVWCGMKERCNNQNNKRYPRYGGRGIRVCPEWETSFESFHGWAIDNGYRDGLTIDRIDNNEGYSPGNCRWVTTSRQNRNYSKNHMIAYGGKTQCVADWADEIGIKGSTILFRLKQGKTLDEVFDKRDGRSLRWQKNR